MPERITVCFRYDDYHARLGEETAEQDAIERRFLDSFAAAGVPLTVGVVPNYEDRRSLSDDAEKLAALRERVADGAVEPALHGLTHQDLTPAEARSSEFAGRPPEEQVERLREGKAQLEEWLGAEVVTCIPPWNTFDAATLEALAATGFRAYSAALSELQRSEGVVSVPHTAGLGDLRRTVRGLIRRRERALVVCMFHHFSFTDCRGPLARAYARLSLDELPRLLAWCRRQDDVECVTIGDAAERCRDLLADGRLAEAAERWRLVYRWRRTRLLGSVLERFFAPRALREPGAWKRGSRWLRRLARLAGGETERVVQ
jgi:predicted deacetylase